MTFVKQVCEGYSKTALIGNWYQQRLYPTQPFRQNLDKQPRQKDQSITCLDNTGFQRALPRLERRTKWQTKNNIILNDKIEFQHSQTKGAYPNYQTQKTGKQKQRPFDKNSQPIMPTDNHPFSESRVKQKSYHYMNNNNPHQQGVSRDVVKYGSDFGSTLISHPGTVKQKRYDTIYGKSFGNFKQDTLKKTASQFNRTRQFAGNFTQVPTQNVKPITTMICQFKKEYGDEKQVTGVQRSWVPQRDKCLSYSVGKSTQDFGKIGVKNDIQTNFNINIGTHNLHPKETPDNYFRHVRNITVKTNNSLCPRQ